MIALPPIQFDRMTGVLEGANAWERLAAFALSSGSKVAANFSHRGYNLCASLLRKTLSERDIANSVLLSLSGSGQVAPAYWLNSSLGLQYLINARAPERVLDSVVALKSLSVGGSHSQRWRGREGRCARRARRDRVRSQRLDEHAGRCPACATT